MSPREVKIDVKAARGLSSLKRILISYSRTRHHVFRFSDEKRDEAFLVFRCHGAIPPCHSRGSIMVPREFF